MKNAQLLYLSPILGTDCSASPLYTSCRHKIFKRPHTSSEEEESAPGGLYSVFVARGPVVVGLTPLAL